MFLGLVRQFRDLLVVLGGFRSHFLGFLDEFLEILVLIEFLLALLVLLALALDLLDEFLLVLAREDLGLLFELELLDLLFEFLEILPLVELHVRLELFDLVEQLVGFGVELVAALLVFLDLLVELVAFLAVLLGLVDLLASLRVEVVALGSPVGGHLVQLVSPVPQLTGHFDELSFRFVF